MGGRPFPFFFPPFFFFPPLFPTAASVVAPVTGKFVRLGRCAIAKRRERPSPPPLSFFSFFPLSLPQTENAGLAIARASASSFPSPPLFSSLRTRPRLVLADFRYLRTLYTPGPFPFPSFPFFLLFLPPS